MQEVRNRFAASIICTAGRSAGPAWNSVLQPGAEHYRRYWTTGVTFDNSAQISAASFVNPAFSHDSSGQDFNVHYGTDPILAFHLGTVATLPQFTKRGPSVKDLIRIAKEQFKDWCLAFRKRIDDGPPNIVIRLWVGDALAFSRALLVFASTNSTTGVCQPAWEATPIILDGQDYAGATRDKAPLKFDMIDTSNLMDHLGLINILVATVPLLQDHPTATLYTNCLLNFHESSGNFASHACTEIATLSLLLGIIPASYVSGFTTQSNMHDVCTSMSGTIKSCQETIPWKKSPAESMPGSLTMAANALGSILFNIYLEMFKDDRISHLFNIQAQLGADSINQYDRSSFAAFLALVKQKVHSDWTQVMEYILSLIERDRTLLMGLNNFQDLYCQLQIHGITSAISAPESRINTSRVFDGWDGVPPVVCVVLRVPRKCLKGLEVLSADEIGTPVFQCEIESLPHNNVFSVCHLFFGTTTPSSSDPHLLIANEDTTRWRGKSPLIVSFYVPSWALAMLPQLMVRLSIHPKSIQSLAIYSVLGPRLCIFSADLLDKTHVQVVRERPGNPLESLKLQGPADPHLQAQSVIMVTGQDATKINGLTGRLNISDPSLQATFRACSSSDITVKQACPFSMLIAFGKAHQETLSFPYPINGSNSKTRLARKSSYIEVSILNRYSGN
ncbi:hypothetical protein C0992_006556 [Termitomyces sp. T32_za158]|nr:hypothetical protein C0992_006556 [Termitomyces sp. T32_za158]